MGRPPKILLWIIAPLIVMIVIYIATGSGSGDSKPQRSSASQILYRAAGAKPSSAPGSTSRGDSFMVKDSNVPDPASYSKLLDSVKSRSVSNALIRSSSAEIFFMLRRSATVYLTQIPPSSVDRLGRDLTAAGASVGVMNGKKKGGFRWGTLFLILMIGLVVGVVIRTISRRGEGAGRRDQTSLRDTEVGQDIGVRFSDVAGCSEVVEEVSEFVDFLVDPSPFMALGAKMPSGLLLYGPPGTGKTLVAKAMAGEAEVPFFAVSGSEFVEKFVGVGASRVRELFTAARACEGGAVIFIDEIDAIGRSRDSGDNNSERDQTLNELLSQMDGFPQGSRVVVVAATNRRDVLDSALLRPGRLGRQVRVGNPDAQGRLEILNLHSRGKPLGDDVDLEALAETTAGCSGADLSDMLNEAAIMAAREGANEISHMHMVEGQLRAIAGPEKRNSMTEKEREMVAYHEAGHVLCAELCEEHEKAQRATIRPRGQAGGLALYGQTDRALHSTQYLHERLICALGGRAAEWVQYGKVSSGAANDLQQANSVARQAVQELGFSPRAGQMIVSSAGQEVRVSDSTRHVVDREVERMVAEAYAGAVRMLIDHGGALEALAQTLLAEEDLSRLEIVAAIGLDNAPPRAYRPAPQMAPQMVPVLHQKRAPRTRSKLRAAGKSATRKLSISFKRPQKKPSSEV